jgi:hypothetical protein
VKTGSVFQKANVWPSTLGVFNDLQAPGLGFCRDDEQNQMSLSQRNAEWPWLIEDVWKLAALTA